MKLIYLKQKKNVGLVLFDKHDINSTNLLFFKLLKTLQI